MFDLHIWLKDRLPGGRATGSGWYRVSCPFHRENTPSFAVKIPSGNWGCRSASCGQHGGLARLVSHVDGISLREAYALINVPNPFNIDEDLTPEETAQIRPSRNGLPQGAVKVSSSRFPAYLAERGYGLQDVEAFGLYFGDDLCEEYRGYLLFPFWDLTGTYKTFTGRTMGKGPHSAPRYRQPDQSVVSASLYGVWRLLQVPKLDRLFVVEGQFDVLRMWQLGLPAVGLSTAATTSAQRRQLVEITKQFDTAICVLLDRGETEEEAARKIAGHLSVQCRTPVYSIDIPQDVKDPDLLTPGHVPIILDMCREVEVEYNQHGGDLGWTLL